MGEEATTKTAKDLTDAEIYLLLTPADKDALSMGKKLKKCFHNSRRIPQPGVLI